MTSVQETATTTSFSAASASSSRQPLNQPKNSNHDNLANDLTKIEPESWLLNHQEWLQTVGYTIVSPPYKPRMAPPSQAASATQPDDTDEVPQENSGQKRKEIVLCYATRESDASTVMLKLVSKSQHPQEEKVTRFFSRKPYISHPANHCAPLLDVLEPPKDLDNDHVVLVFPLLWPFDIPPLGSVGEAVEFIRQMFQGLRFMHQCHVAHRNCSIWNIMMDPKPLFPDERHVSQKKLSKKQKAKAQDTDAQIPESEFYSRTLKPTTFYFIDFSASAQFDPSDGPPHEVLVAGDDRIPIELSNSQQPSDPYANDVYCLGDMMRTYFLERTRGAEFIAPLVTDMLQLEQDNRPTIDEVVKRFEGMYGKLPWWKLRSRLVIIEEEEGHRWLSFSRDIRYYGRAIKYILHRNPAIPTPIVPYP